MVQFALSGLVVLVLLGIAGAFVLSRQGRAESIRDARTLTAALGRGVVEPGLDDRLLDSHPDAIARIDRAVRRNVLSDDVVRVKIWSRTGRIVYSDEPRLIGMSFGLDADKLAAIDFGRTEAELSNLSESENRFERTHGKLLEVYLPVRTPSGVPLLFETYQRYSSIAAGGREIWLAFAPALIVALVLLWLVQLPLALSLARHVRDSQRERECLLRQAIESSEAERHRIAADLHDGVVQDLAAISYSLAATAERLPADGPLASTLHTAASGTRQSMRRLRSLLVEIYPPNLATVGLSAALSDVTARLAVDGMDVRVDIPDDLRLPSQVEALFFRAAQEALRNVAEHAAASTVDVRIAVDNGHATLVVEDDGRGFSWEELERQRADGHVGLRLLDELASEAGGTLDLGSGADAGTRLRLEVPTA